MTKNYTEKIFGYIFQKQLFVSTVRSICLFFFLKKRSYGVGPKPLPCIFIFFLLNVLT